MSELLRRFPSLLHTLRRVDLRVHESPVEWWTVGDTRLLIKRDDLCAPLLGGNKVRSLEYLLGGVGPDVRLLSVGSTGSTHAMALALYGNRVGAPCDIITWPQEENVASRATRRRLAGLANVTAAGSVIGAYAKALVRRIRPSVLWIPAGGSSALGALGHTNGMLECLAQLARIENTELREIVVPLGSGGTAAGMLVGLSLAASRIRLVAARVVPRIVANRRRVLRLARQARALLSTRAGVVIPDIDESLLEIDGRAFGGAYARETEDSKVAARRLAEAGGPVLDGTYSAKALAVALKRAAGNHEGSVLFWLTFDGRWLEGQQGSGKV